MYQQTLDPIGGSLGWSAAIAAIPLLAMFAMLGLLRWKAHRSALIALVLAIVIALVGWGMSSATSPLLSRKHRAPG